MNEHPPTGSADRNAGEVAEAELPTLDLEGARAAVSGIAVETPLLPAPALDAATGLTVRLKPENLQTTGSFKVRGAAARMAQLTAGERERGVVACSSGNHGRAVARVAGRLGVAATICVPSWVDPVKREAMEADGAEVVLAGDTYDEAAERATRLREERGAVFVHPFDDPAVVAGQATVGLEILDALTAPDPVRILVPLSGGGLAGGIAYAVKRRRPGTRVVAVSAERARVMVESLGAGRPVQMEEEETLASALSGGIGSENRHTLSLVRELVDEHVLVDEEAIGRAMTFAARRLRLVVEGGGAVGLAALLSGRVPADDGSPGRSGTTVVVVSGGNVELRTLADLADRGPGTTSAAGGSSRAGG